MLALLLGVTRLEFIAVLGAVSLVLIAEMFNTAIEAAIDALVTHYHPLVKVAKDVSAGRRAGRHGQRPGRGLPGLLQPHHRPDARRSWGSSRAPSQIVVGSPHRSRASWPIAIKAAVGRGTPLRGGLPSGHAAAAFAGVGGDHRRLERRFGTRR